MGGYHLRELLTVGSSVPTCFLQHARKHRSEVDSEQKRPTHTLGVALCEACILIELLYTVQCNMEVWLFGPPELSCFSTRVIFTNVIVKYRKRRTYTVQAS